MWVAARTAYAKTLQVSSTLMQYDNDITVLHGRRPDRSIVNWTRHEIEKDLIPTFYRES
jgi:hypothetical protein